MIPFDHLLRMMVVHLLITVILCIKDFAWTKVASKILPHLVIVEGIVLDFNLCFRVTIGEFVQTREGTNNAIHVLYV